MKPNFLSGFLMVLVGALVAFASLFWLPHCGGETPMRCVWLLRASTGVGFMILVSGVVMKFVAAKTAAGIQIGNVLMGLLLIALAAFLIGSCPNPMMACHRVTDPALIVIGVLVALVAAVDAWRLSKKA